MEFYGYNAQSSKGLGVMRQFSDDLKETSGVFPTSLTVETARLRMSDMTDGQGRFRRPYVDMTTKINGFYKDNDYIQMTDEDAYHTRYQYELSDQQIVQMIDNGLYSDSKFEEKLSRQLEDRQFVTESEVTMYSMVAEHDGVLVPYVVTGDFKGVSFSSVDREDNYQDSFGPVFSHTLDTLDEYNRKLESFESDIIVDPADDRFFEDTELTFDGESNEYDEEAVVDMDGHTASELEGLYSNLQDSDDFTADELLDVPEGNVSVNELESANKNGLKTLKERQAELESTSTDIDFLNEGDELDFS